MTNLSVTTFAQQTIGRMLDDFSREVCASSDATDTSCSRVKELRSASLHATAALERFGQWSPREVSMKLLKRLRASLKTADGIQELRAFISMTNDEQMRSHAGLDLLRVRADRRLERYLQDLSALRSEISSPMTDRDNLRLLDNLNWREADPEPELLEFAQTSLSKAASRIDLPVESESAHFTMVHELLSELEEVSNEMEVFRTLLVQREWQAVSAHIDDLCDHVAAVADCSSVRMRCTKWLEKSRDKDEADAMRNLANVAMDEYARQFAKLVERWNPRQHAETQESFARALNFVSAPM